MRWPRLIFTTRGLLFAVALVSLNLAGALRTRDFDPASPHTLRGGWFLADQGDYTRYTSDGSVEVWDRDFKSGCLYLREQRQPPTLLRIWSPFITTLSISLLVLGFSLSGLSLPRMTPRRLAIVVPIAIVTTWLILPLAEIAADPQGDYHEHDRFHLIVHRNPFWPRYWRRLMGHPSPGASVCPYHPRGNRGHCVA